MIRVKAGNQWLSFKILQPCLTTAPHSEGWYGFVFIPRCLFTIRGDTVSTPRFVASHLPFLCISFISESCLIRFGEQATADSVMCVVPIKLAPADFRPFHKSVMASALGTKSLLSQP